MTLRSAFSFFLLLCKFQLFTIAKYVLTLEAYFTCYSHNDEQIRHMNYWRHKLAPASSPTRLLFVWLQYGLLRLSKQDHTWMGGWILAIPFVMGGGLQNLD